MSTVLRPKVSLNILPALQEVSIDEQKVLFIGQKTSAGTATSGALVQNILNDGSENTLFGEKSMLAGMIRAAKVINKVTRMDAIALDDHASGVAAEAEVVFTGPATAAGTLYVTVGSTENHKYEIAISSGDSATVIGGKLVSAIGADSKAIVTAANVTGTVTLTAVNAGLEGNDIALRYEGTVAGVTVTLTAFAGGATNPSLTGLFDVIEGVRYQTIVWPSSYDIDDVKDFLDARFNVDNEVLDGRAVITKSDTYANLLTLGNTYNSQNLVIFGNRKLSDTDFKGGSLLELNNNISAQFAAIRALRFAEGISISRYVVGATRGALDAFGGPGSASLPYFNTPFFDLPIIPVGKGFSKEEIDDLANAGISVFGNNAPRTVVILSDVVTTYKTDVAGNLDKSFKYLNYVDTISVSREYMVNNARVRFAQTRLTEGDLVPRRNMANETVIRDFFTRMYINLSGSDYVLTQAGEDALEFFKQNLNVSIDMDDGRVTVNMVTPIVTQLRAILGTIQIAFSTQAIQ
jgi:phage tail sheath gpL-like